MMACSPAGASARRSRGLGAAAGAAASLRIGVAAGEDVDRLTQTLPAHSSRLQRRFEHRDVQSSSTSTASRRAE